MQEQQSPDSGQGQQFGGMSPAEIFAQYGEAGILAYQQGQGVPVSSEADAEDRTQADAGHGERPEAGPLTPEQQRQVGEIVGHISDSAVYGKFHDGTHFKTGDLPEVTIHRSDWDDYGMFPQDSILRDIQHRVLSHVGTLFQDPKIARNRHYMFAVPVGKSGTVVNYFFEGDYRDKGGRPVGMVHLATLMPTQDAERLKALVAENPDAAEAYFQQVGQGLESPGPGPGIGRTESESVVLLGNWDLRNPPLDSSGRKTEQFRSVFGRDAYSELPYSKSYGSVKARSN